MRIRPQTAPTVQRKLGLAGQREEHCPAHPGLRQVQPNRRHVLPRRLAFDAERDRYTCPAGKSLSNSDAPTPFPEAASQPRAQDFIAPANWIATPADSNHSAARTLLPARSRGICTKTPATWPAHAATPQYVEACRRRKKVEMLFAHLKRILRLARLRLRGPNGAKDEFLLAATAQNLRRLARLRPINMVPEMLAA